MCCGCGETVECCADCEIDCNGRCGWIEDKESVITQPELPVMKNMAQREEFINSYITITKVQRIKSLGKSKNIPDKSLDISKE